VKLSQVESYEVEDSKIAELLGPFSYVGFFSLTDWDSSLFSREVSDTIRKFSYVTDQKIEDEMRNILRFMRENEFHEKTGPINKNKIKTFWINVKKSLACSYVVSFLHEDAVYEWQTNWIIVEKFKTDFISIFEKAPGSKKIRMEELNFRYTGGIHDMLSVTSELYAKEKYVSPEIKKQIEFFSKIKTLLKDGHFFEEKALYEKVKFWVLSLLKIEEFEKKDESS